MMLFFEQIQLIWHQMWYNPSLKHNYILYSFNFELMMMMIDWIDPNEILWNVDQVSTYILQH